MQVAVLDLGTNTFHLLIANIGAGGKAKIVYQETIAVRLGEGGIEEGTISNEAFSRGVSALKIFKGYIDFYQVEEVKSAATSAIRTASNGIEFLEKVQAETGLRIEIIDGNEEAILIYLGVNSAVNLEANSLIVDIGGGSVELIIADKNKIFWQRSYPIGAARLMSRFHRHDPILKSEVEELINYLNETLSEFHDQLRRFKPKLMIGSAGSFETFAQMQNSEFKPSFDKPEFDIDLVSFEQISNRIIESNHEQREKMPDLPPVRVDMIVVSTILARYIINLTNIDTLKLSSYSLKEGLLFGPKR